MPRLVFVTDQAIDRIFPRARSSILENPGSPSRGFLLRFMRRQPRGRRRPSGRPADRPRHGRRASRRAPPHRGARACADAIARGPGGLPRRDQAGRNRRAWCIGSGGRPARRSSRSPFSLQIGCVEAFGEPTVYGRERVAGFGTTALVASEFGRDSRRRALPRAWPPAIGRC